MGPPQCGCQPSSWGGGSCSKADKPPAVWIPGTRPGGAGAGGWGTAVAGGSGQQLGLRAGWSLDAEGSSTGLGRSPLPGCPPAVSPVPKVCVGGGWHAWGGAEVWSWPAGHAVPPPAEEVLESYENPPPIVLPSEGFQVDLEADCLDDSIYQHLLYIRHFLWSLRKPTPVGGPARPECEVPGPAVRARTPVTGWSGQQPQAWLPPLGVPGAPPVLPLRGPLST